jgi:hypothetical protein
VVIAFASFKPLASKVAAKVVLPDAAGPVIMYFMSFVF